MPERPSERRPAALRTVAAFLIAPLPVALCAVGNILWAHGTPRFPLPVMFVICLAILWCMELVPGLPILLLMRRRGWQAWWHYAIGGAIMTTLATAPLCIFMWHNILKPLPASPYAQSIEAMVIVGMVRTQLLTALSGAVTGLLFCWLWRGRRDRGSDLVALRERFE